MLEAINTYINDRYGSNRGLLNLWWFGVQYKLGRFACYGKVDWSRVGNLVFVCHGNICRSPLGEAVAQQRFRLNAESYGIDCDNGAPADKRAVRFAGKLGIDLTQHASRHILQYQPADSDLVVVMEPKHLLQLPRHIAAKAQITMAGLWLAHPQPYVHDPFCSTESHFERCEQTVVRGIEGIAAQWQSRRP